MLLSFEPSAGRHTGKAIGRELVSVIRMYRFEDKVRLAITPASLHSLFLF